MSLKKSMSELERLSSDEFKSSEKIPIVVVLDDVRSMHNVGSVFRTCDAFLIESICLCGFTPQPPHRDIQKTALGATETVSWKHYSSTKEAVENLMNKGYKIYSVEQVHNSIPLHEFKLDKSLRYAFVFGNEINGVDDEIIKLSDGVIEIPQLGSKHSLNISVSTGIVLWEMIRQLI
jgi:23S rRNA (guanosine2251-2'-O)-methyltransferase